MKKELEYPMWENGINLRCKYLRGVEKWIPREGEAYFWIAKEKDPCPICENNNCHNYKKHYDMPNKLIIEKGI
jgi:hypothetical protein